jgi:hypothetical protein
MRTGGHFKLEDFLPSGVLICFSGGGDPRNLTLDMVSESVLEGGSMLGASDCSIVPCVVVIPLLLHLVCGVAEANWAKFSFVHVKWRWGEGDGLAVAVGAAGTVRVLLWFGAV